MTKLLLIPLVAYLALVALLYAGQRSLLYLPGKRAAGGAELAALGLERWPDEARYRGYLLDAPSAEGTVVVFHGNAGDAIDRLYYAEALGFAGARLLLAEYPGYGARPGRPSERVLVADARETIARVRARYPDEPLYVVGESLGAGVAAAAVGATGLENPPPPIDGLLLLTPWDSLAAVAAHHYPFVPVRWLLRDRYRSAHHLRDVGAVKAVVVAERDEVVPAAFGRALHDALPPPKRLFVVEGADHNGWFGRVDRRWWRAVWSASSETPEPAAKRGDVAPRTNVRSAPPVDGSNARRAPTSDR